MNAEVGGKKFNVRPLLDKLGNETVIFDDQEVAEAFAVNNSFLDGEPLGVFAADDLIAVAFEHELFRKAE